MKTTLIGTALFVLTAAAVAFYPAVKSSGSVVGTTNHTSTQIDPVHGGKPKIDVVFVLDTTGSMSGLIDAAKEKIWSIATSMASAQPAPEIRIGLVAYRDRGDAYVTRVVDLSSDIDTMYATLMQFTADGGGDGPESVNQALNDAVTKMSWSQDANAYKVIFLVGDAPPHMDYQDDVKYPQTLESRGHQGHHRQHDSVRRTNRRRETAGSRSQRSATAATSMSIRPAARSRSRRRSTPTSRVCRPTSTRRGCTTARRK